MLDLYSDESNNGRAAFLSTIFGQNQGYICIAAMHASHRDNFKEKFFVFPDQMPEALRYIASLIDQYNIYVCPQILEKPIRQKEHVSITNCAWADLDTCKPDNLYIEPSVVVESSPGRWQAYWIFERPVDVDDTEDLCRRIAYKHAHQGADRSGWDLTQLLRVPLTYNFKYKHTPSNEHPVVSVTSWEPSKFRLKDFERHYPDVAEHIPVKVPKPTDEELPDKTGLDILNDIRIKVNPRLWQLFNETPQTDSWSEPLWNLQMLCFEAGLSREETFIVARDAACNKYERDGRPEIQLWKDVCRAWAQQEMQLRLLTQGVVGDIEKSLLTNEERERVSKQPKTFVERYQEWARTLGDAAHQYHQAGAFVALSSLLAGAVRLPTSFGTIIPNLWFMILADTTLTRKTTSMDIAMDMIEQIDSNTILATDGSIEGLLTSLATRPGIPSVFLRDEFSGLLEAMSKKDYMAGMPELLTKLYDAKMQRRVLRKEVIEVREPVLILFAGGIKERVTQLLSFEMVSSGFMPRFIFITAESDPNKLKPIGPPTGTTRDTGEHIRNELQSIYDHYRRVVALQVEGVKNPIERPMTFDVELTEDAWFRYNKFEADMYDIGLASDRPDVITPMYDRLSKSILKAAVLLAAARQRADNVIVTEDDILRAIMYGEQWRVHAREVMRHVGKGHNEKRLESVHRQIARKPGITRSEVMQYHHLSAREATEVFQTLIQRGLVNASKAGKTEVLNSLVEPSEVRSGK